MGSSKTAAQLDQVDIEVAAGLACIGLNGAALARELAADHRAVDDEKTAAGLDELADQLQAIGDQCANTWRSLTVDKGLRVQAAALQQLVATLARPPGQG